MLLIWPGRAGFGSCRKQQTIRVTAFWVTAAFCLIHLPEDAVSCWCLSGGSGAARRDNPFQVPGGGATSACRPRRVVPLRKRMGARKDLRPRYLGKFVSAP